MCDLTERELAILQELADDHTLEQASYKLGISVNTIQSHMRHVKAVLGARSTLGACVIAVRRELID